MGEVHLDGVWSILLYIQGIPSERSSPLHGGELTKLGYIEGALLPRSLHHGKPWERHEWKEQGLLKGFLKKFSFGQMGYFGPQNGAFS